jgi:GMP synthase-like glutamine amidotransferase
MQAGGQMILIISVCTDELSHFEFVKPIEDIMKKIHSDCITKHYTKLNRQDLEQAQEVIICGTALKDFNYLKNIDQFSWLKEHRKPVLGICAGMQLLAIHFGSTLIESEKIGQYQVKTNGKNALTSRTEFRSYFLNSKTTKLSDEFQVLGQSGNTPCIIKHKSMEYYGCLFHPEVLNAEIIENFVTLSTY